MGSWEGVNSEICMGLSVCNAPVNARNGKGRNEMSKS